MGVLCTAGHVDHGKSTLVRALTGMEPDRFAEERRRGLTIDLGFAWTEIEGATVSFVDLPGHERFIGNMLAGAGGIDLAMFVVAADEGWKPQSAEHLAILDLLEVRKGVVVLTKIDATTPETTDRTARDVAARLRGTSLEGTEILRVSAVSGEGLDDLRRSLHRLVVGAPQPADTQRPRLWVDRSFTIRGAGTVVTGTLGGGCLRTGDAVVVEPGGRPGRIRGLQSLKATVDVAAPGSRVAVNLSGVERDAVGRGDAVVTEGQWLQTTVVDAWVRALPGAEIGRRGAWHVHVGAGERLARLEPLAGPVTADGPVRLELNRAAPLTAGDRFVLRDSGRRATLGGGVVLDPDPPRVTGAAGRSARAAALEVRRRALADGDLDRLLALHVEERDAVRLDAAAAAVGLSSDGATRSADEQRLPRLADFVASPAAASRWTAATMDGLAAHHAAHPVDRFAQRDVALRAATRAGCPPQLAPRLLEVLVRLGRVVAEGAGVRHPDHAVRLDPVQQRARDVLVGALGAEPFRPPPLGSAATAAGVGAALLRELEASGDVVRLGPDLAMTASAVRAAERRLRAVYAAEGAFTAARAKEALATSRKYALPLLEELDRRGVTRRSGDVREMAEPG